MQKNSMILHQSENNSIINELPSQVVIERLKKIFSKSIGKENGINLFELFEAVYGDIKCNKFQFEYLMNHKIYPAINFLKRKTNYFIIGERVDDTYLWYILRDNDELDNYHQQIESKVTGLRIMQTKAMRHVMDKKWKELEG